MLEYQRYGRNKDTVINHTYIKSGEYRRKFDKITSNSSVNRILYLKAKEMLFHRSGTLYEDMYWIDADTGKIVASALNESSEEKVEYSKAISGAIDGKTNLITMHTHPNSLPPSIADFNSCCEHKYFRSFVICHDGTIYEYSSNQNVSSNLYMLYIHEFRILGYTEKDAQLKALNEIKQTYKINFQEV